MENILKNHLFAARAIALLAVFSLLATAFAFVFSPASVVADDHEDTVGVEATVQDFLALDITENTLDLGILRDTGGQFSIGNDDTSVEVSTNDSGGYTVTIQGTGDGDESPGLWDDENSLLIPSATGQVNANGETENYGVTVPVADGDIATDYDHDEDGQTSGSVGIVPLSSATLVTHNAAVTGHTFTLRARASVDEETTPSPDYEDTITLTVTGGIE